MSARSKIYYWSSRCNRPDNSIFLLKISDDNNYYDNLQKGVQKNDLDDSKGLMLVGSELNKRLLDLSL